MPDSEGELPDRADAPVFVVGIGASAGGLGAAEEFIRALPDRPGVAFVIVQHLAPDRESEMADLLQSHTQLPVAQARDGMPAEPDHIYTIRPGHRLTLEDGHLRLSRGEGRGGHVPAAIDVFLRSLAADRGEDCACVILSGTGTDGTLGLKAVKEAGGLALVQSPEDAEYDGMPRSAVGTGLADIVADAGTLASRLLEVRKNASSVRVPEEPAELPGDATAALTRIFTQLRERTGHDFTHYKRSSVLRRIGRRLHVTGLTDLPEFLEYVRQNPDELDALFQDLMISVTNFFRDPAAWGALRDEVVPGLFEGKSPNDGIRAWVPGCATGEEAYSVAILLCEHARKLSTPPQIQVFGSDIDEQALEFARTAVYPEAIVSDVPETLLRRYFDEAPGGFRVSKSIRDIVLFAPHNLLRDPPFSRLDLITCRNLLIYLNREVQESSFELFHYALRPGGVLFLGSSESAEGASRLFSVVDKRHRVYRRRSIPARPPSFPTVASVEAPEREVRMRAEPRERDRSVAERHRAWLMERRVPPSILVARDYEICHVAGGANRFLREVDGVPSRDLMEKILPELRLDVRAALIHAFQKNQPARARSTVLDLPEGRRSVEVVVEPLDEEQFQGRYAEVLFVVSDEDDGGEPLPARPEDPDVASQLEDELDRTRERLQTIVEEYETSNEELKASNEELQSMNEELRSTTEELETGKEELQSMNEELVTVNQELRNKIEELNRANSDLQNLMAATDIGTIFLDRELRIKRYTPRAQDLFHLQPSDIGRPLEALTQRLGPDDLVALARQVLRDLTPLEREERADDGSWYLTRLRPYRSVDDAIEGVVLSFLDVTTLKEAERTASFQADVLSQVADAVVATNNEGRIIYLNAAAAERYEVDPDEALGQRLDRLVEIRYEGDDSRERALRSLEDTGGWQGPVTHVTRSGRTIQVDARVTVLEDADGEPVGRLGVLRDMTAQREAEALAYQRQQYLRTALRNVPLVAAFVDHDLRYRWVHNPHPDFDPESVVGKRDDELLPPEEAEPLMALKREVLQRREGIRRELRFPRSDGIRVYDMTVDPLYDESGRLVGLTTAGLDVTQQKLANEELAQAKAEAEAANESKAAFLAAMSHELRTPLNAITGYVDLLEMGIPTELSEGQEEHVGRIRVSARHLLQLIEEILLYARVEAQEERVEPGEVRLADLLEEVEAILQPLTDEKDLELRVGGEDPDEVLRVDARKVRQILLNLMGNAVKFTDHGRVELQAERQDGILRFRILDTGTGLSAAEVESLFEPFWQGEHDVVDGLKGTGLGLTIVKRYVELMGGTIDVNSQPGAGSIFTVELPLAGE